MNKLAADVRVTKWLNQRAIRLSVLTDLQRLIRIVIDECHQDIFNSKKGDTVRIPLKNGKEQVWRCIDIKKLK